MKNKIIYKMIIAALFLALAIVLPFFTGQIPGIGAMLLPMHLPVLICAYFAGPLFAGIIGFIAPLLRFALFGMPPFMPTGISMAFELLTYGVVAGILYKALPKKKINVYISLIVSMLAGRVVWGVVRVILLGLGKSEFGWAAFMSGAFITAIPGIVIQLILIPIIVIAFDKYTIK